MPVQSTKHHLLLFSKSILFFLIVPNPLKFRHVSQLTTLRKTQQKLHQSDQLDWDWCATTFGSDSLTMFLTKFAKEKKTLNGE